MPSSNNHDHNVTELTATVMVQTEAALMNTPPPDGHLNRPSQTP